MTVTTKQKQTARESGARKKETQGSGVQGQKSAVTVLRQAEGGAIAKLLRHAILVLG